MVKNRRYIRFAGRLNANNLKGQELIGGLTLTLAIHECETGMYRPTSIGKEL